VHHVAGRSNILAEKFAADVVGIVVDVYHVWWDAMLEREVARARGRVRALHVCDWLVPTPDMLMGRGMMGDGCIDIAYIRSLVDDAGYTGASRWRSSIKASGTSRAMKPCSA